MGTGLGGSFEGFGEGVSEGFGEGFGDGFAEGEGEAASELSGFEAGMSEDTGVLEAQPAKRVKSKEAKAIMQRFFLRRNRFINRTFRFPGKGTYSSSFVISSGRDSTSNTESEDSG